MLGSFQRVGGWYVGWQGQASGGSVLSERVCNGQRAIRPRPDAPAQSAHQKASQPTRRCATGCDEKIQKLHGAAAYGISRRRKGWTSAPSMTPSWFTSAPHAIAAKHTFSS